MEHRDDVLGRVKRTVGISFGSFMDGFNILAGKMKNELYYLKDRKDLFVKNLELRSVIAGLGNVKKDCYCAKGVIYRRDIHDVMHRVALIQVECGKIMKDMAARHGSRNS